jgi:hypothetical protein
MGESSDQIRLIPVGFPCPQSTAVSFGRWLPEQDRIAPVMSMGWMANSERALCHPNGNEHLVPTNTVGAMVEHYAGVNRRDHGDAQPHA